MKTVQQVTEDVRFSAKFLLDVAELARKFPNERILDTLYRGQIASKVWLVQELDKLDIMRKPASIAVCGSWYSILPRIITELSTTIVPWRVRSIDIDPLCAAPSMYLNLALNENSYRFEFVRASMLGTWYDENLVINTSMEHVAADDAAAWLDSLKPGTVVVMQGNNSPEPDHVNPILSFDHFPKNGFEEIHRDTLLLYDDNIRRMLIGVKR